MGLGMAIVGVNPGRGCVSEGCCQQAQGWWLLLQVEIEEASVKPRREPIRLLLSRPRRGFNQPFRLADKDAHELWNSSQMECR